VAMGPRDFIDPNTFYPNTLRFMENSILAFLQALFSTFPARNQLAGPVDYFNYHYDPIDELSEISIEGQNTDNLNKVDSRPKIVVARGAVGYNKVGINNFVGSSSMQLSPRRHATILSGTVGISCFSREDLEADRLAMICADAIEQFNFVIRKHGYLQIHTTQIGQRALIIKDSRPELHVTPVLIKTEVTKNWTTQTVDPVRLRKVLLQSIVNPGGLLQESEV
jgi:hypothetical protein